MQVLAWLPRPRAARSRQQRQSCFFAAPFALVLRALQRIIVILASVIGCLGVPASSRIVLSTFLRPVGSSGISGCCQGPQTFDEVLAPQDSLPCSAIILTAHQYTLTRDTRSPSPKGDMSLLFYMSGFCLLFHFPSLLSSTRSSLSVFSVLSFLRLQARWRLHSFRLLFHCCA